MIQPPDVMFRDYALSILRRAIAEYTAADALEAEVNAKVQSDGEGLGLEHQDFLERWQAPARDARWNAELVLIRCIRLLVGSEDPETYPGSKGWQDKPCGAVVDGTFYGVMPDPNHGSKDGKQILHLFVVPMAEVPTVEPEKRGRANV